jgi:VWFA-related protein
MLEFTGSFSQRTQKLLFIFLLSSILSRSQQQPSAPSPLPTSPPTSQGAANVSEITQHDAAVTFTSKSNLVPVPVVVRDRQHQAVGTLRKEDFLLFDNGKPQVITTFAVEKTGIPSIPATVATDESAPEKPQPAPPPIAERFVAYVFDDMNLATGDLMQMRVAMGRHLDESLEPTTRAAIFTSSGEISLDFTSDRAKLHETLDRLKPMTGMLFSGNGNLGLVQVLGALGSSIERISRMPGSRNIVLISPGFVLSNEFRANEIGLLDLALHSNVTINTLQARGLYTYIPGGDASHANSRLSALSATTGEDVLAELADGTGGTYFHNDNGLKEGLDRLAARPEYIYVLGFAPQNLRYDGNRHSLKVTVKDAKDFDLQARRRYYAPGHAPDPEQQAKEEIREAVFSRDEIQDLPVELHLQFFKTSDAAATLAVLARVDLRHVRFRKAEDRNKNTLTIVSSLFDPNGNYIKGIQKVVDLNLRDQTLEALPASGVTVRTNLDVAPGSYVVRLVVRDSEGQAMAARNGVVKIP